MKKLFKIIFLIVVLAVIAAGFLFYSSKDVSVVSANVTSAEELSITGITLRGYVDVYNGGFLPAGVENITYNVTLENVDGIIGKGFLDGGIIKPKETKRFPVSIRIAWVPSIETALDLLFSDSTFARVEGVVNIASIKVVRVRLPFSARANIKGYIEQFAIGLPEVIPGGIVYDVIGIVEDIAGNMTGEAKDVADAIEDFIS